MMRMTTGVAAVALALHLAQFSGALRRNRAGDDGIKEAVVEPKTLTCGQGTAGKDYCCPMAGDQAACQEEAACQVLNMIEDGKLWTAVGRGPVEDPMYNGPSHNRMVIMALDAGVGGHADKSLVLVNAIPLSDALRDELLQLEVDQRATVRYVLSTGDWHWMFLGDYLAPFPGATAYVPPGRIPLEQSPQFAYTVLDINAPLKELRPGLQIHNFDGLIQPQFGFYSENATRNELFFFHGPSKTLVAGDLMWLWSCEPTDAEKREWPAATAGAVHIWNMYGVSMWSARASEITRARRSAELLLYWDFTRFISVHGGPGNMVTPDANPNAKALINSALRGTWGVPPQAWAGVTVTRGFWGITLNALLPAGFYQDSCSFPANMTCQNPKQVNVPVGYEIIIGSVTFGAGRHNVQRGLPHRYNVTVNAL